MIRILTVFTGAMCFDGITNSVYDYYNAMDRTGMQIDIVSARSTDPLMKQKFEALGCNVYPLEYRDKNTFSYIIKLIMLIRKGRYDILHAHGNSATLAFETVAALLGGCKIRIVHSRNSSCEYARVDKVLRPVMYATYTNGFACGEAAGKWLFGDRPFTVMHNGKNIQRFLFRPDVRKQYREKLNVSDDIIVLGHVGLFHKQKNHEFLIRVFQEICHSSEQYKLVLIGEGEEQTRIEQMVNELELKDKVIFLGKQINVEDWLQALDIMVFPSLFEGLPNVVLEWQLAGLHSVISDRITCECQITDQVKYLPLEVGVAAWAQYITELTVFEREGKQFEICQQFAAAGYDITTNARYLRNCYLELAKEDKR